MHNTGNDVARPHKSNTAVAAPTEIIRATVVTWRRSTRKPMPIDPITAAKLKSERVIVPEINGIGRRRA